MSDTSHQNDPAAAAKSSSGQESDAEGQSTPRAPIPEKRSLLSTIFPFLRNRAGNTLREDIDAALAEEHHDDSAFSPEERAMLHNILRLRELRVEDVMIPRADIEAVEISTSLGDLLEMFEKSGHSRMPVFAETLDDPRGMVHIRDVVNHITKVSRPKAARRTARSAKTTAGAKLDFSNVDLTKSVADLNLMRPVLFVPPSMLANELMARMQAQRIQIALVIDEYGGTDGLVSLEDVVEMVVGDIEDEHDDDEVMITAEADGSFIADARAELEEIAEAIGPAFIVGEHGEDVDTVGGLIFSILGRIPVRGETVQAVPGYEFHVLEVDPRRIRKVRIAPVRHGERRTSRPDARDEVPQDQSAQERE
ncbi:hemolysin family protein [Phyllobacterium sp. 21LDTY02-6]|jgi:CBS domain containing-hemolysin-like protein|uniref:hemolysin family protein n=1 Tax=unclassified Phyllobacterium TaxID=2638441 RepID=UPI002020B9E1|nr:MULTISPECIES: hemolysin family protein [unclassified Phyllobacterium]MCO4316902.1 hemolysin family protein [Phyllobacterium sp. 21LDTY02-6]MCX8281817.1 hemolysin family protein [Phyllobacterium sp. 0TCS1.6C]MCX8295352.1 hemolysin family protein [Phyllobacterium sp. 0TCS1.6A]